MAMAAPQDSLSVKLISPYTNAEASVVAPTRSAVSDRLVTSICAPPKPNTLKKTCSPYPEGYS